MADFETLLEEIEPVSTDDDDDDVVVHSVKKFKSTAPGSESESESESESWGESLKKKASNIALRADLLKSRSHRVVLDPIDREKFSKTAPKPQKSKPKKSQRQTAPPSVSKWGQESKERSQRKPQKSQGSTFSNRLRDIRAESQTMKGSPPTRSTTLRGGAAIAVAVDGSQHSVLALQEAQVFARPHDSVAIMTVFDPRKEYLPEGFKKEGIAKVCTKLFSQGPKTSQRKFKHVAAALRPGDTTPRLLAGLCKASQIRYLFCGYVGRKGPKLQNTVPGRVTDFVLTQAPCTTVILKTKTSGTQARCAVVGLDGSARAFRALKETLQLFQSIIEPSVHVVHVMAGFDGMSVSDHEILAQEVENEAVRLSTKFESVEFSFTKLKCRSKNDIGDTLIDFGLSCEANFLSVGTDGLSAEQARLARPSGAVGSVADHIVRFSEETNVLVCNTSS